MKKFNRIIILLKKNLELELDILRKIQDIFKESKIEVVSFDECSTEIINDSDLIITIGGDGTFVKAANLIEDSFILGINANPDKSEGAATSLDLKDIEKLANLNEGKFQIQEWQRASTILNGKLLEAKAINEVYIGAASQFHSSRYKIKFKDKEEEQRSSGIIVSTGVGSRAWFLSAGGKPFSFDEKKLKFIIREPYQGKRVFTPKILGGEILENEKLIVESTRDFGGIIAINDSIHDFNTGDIVEVKLCEKPLKVIKFLS
jgi:hypothetical protein